jgi:hypothetical protein
MAATGAGLRSGGPNSEAISMMRVVRAAGAAAWIASLIKLEINLLELGRKVEVVRIRSCKRECHSLS